MLSGFKVVTDVITSKKKRALMWVVGLITFFMSAVLDNLTTTIVMVSLVKKVILVTLVLFTHLIDLLADFDWRLLVAFLPHILSSFFSPFYILRFYPIKKTGSCSEQ